MNDIRSYLRGLAVAGAALVVATAALAARPTEELRAVGATAMIYKGPLVQVALSYKFPKLVASGDWLFLDTVITATQEPLEISRTAVSVRTPTGEIVPLASQEEFASAYPALRSAIARANVMAEPLNYFPPYAYRPMRLFSEGRNIAFPSFWLDGWHDTFGRLFFRLPNGIQRGDYALLIHLKEGDVTVPFTL